MQFEIKSVNFLLLSAADNLSGKIQRLSGLAWTDDKRRDGLVSTDDEHSSKRIIKEHYRIVRGFRVRIVSTPAVQHRQSATTQKPHHFESFQLFSLVSLQRMFENGRNVRHSLILAGDFV